jgi:hypothetical protein
MMKTFVLGALLAQVALADAVTDWNGILRSATSAEAPQAQSRFAAITHLAVFEAVNAITGDYEPYLRTVNAASGASPEAAAIAAAHQVLRNYFPAQADTLDADRARSLAAIQDSPAKTAGIAVGQAAAAAMIAQRANDGSATPIPYTPLTGIGFWQPTPPAFAAATFLHWGRMTPFGIARADQFRPKPPPALTSNRYRRDYNEVKHIGDTLSNIDTRPQDRIDVVRFVAMTSPTQIWNAVAIQLSEAAGLSLAENARLFALLNMAIADAAIAVFEAKFVYNLWRPVTAIRAGDIDGNAGTEPDPAFNAFIATPPYPAYPSGAGGLGNAGRSMVERIFGRGRHPVTLSNPALDGVTLQYTNLRHITDDTADARIYGGIHFRFDQEASEVLGERVAAYVLRNNLRCARRGACDDGGDEE